MTALFTRFRRARHEHRRSDLTRFAGRFWSPESPWNQPGGPATETTMDLGGLTLNSGDGAPVVVYKPPDVTTMRFPPSPVVYVDFDNRFVATYGMGEIDTVDLDALDPWGSAAAGLVLERELVRGEIAHAVAVVHPDPALYGARFRIERPTTGTLAERALGEALAAYGGIVVGEADRPAVLAERIRPGLSGAAPTYQAVGIGSAEQDLPTLARIPGELLVD